MSTPNPDSRPTLQDFDKYQWATVLGKIEPKQCQRYSEEFRARAEAYGLADDMVGQKVFNFLSSITSILMEPLGRKNMSFLEEEVSLSLSDEQLTLLRELVVVVADPELRARIADILWICKRDPEGSRPIQMAKLAVESYLQSAKNLEDTENGTLCSCRLQRATQLASIVDKNKKSTTLCYMVVTHIEELIDRYTDIENEFMTSGAMTIIQKNLLKDLRTLKADLPSYSTTYAKLAAQKAIFAASIQNHHEAFYQKQEYRQLESEWYKIAGDKEMERKAAIQCAELEVWYAQQALVQNEPDAYAIAAGRIENAIASLEKIESNKKFGRRQDTSNRMQELHKQMLAYQKQSMSQTAYVPIPTDAFHDPKMQKTARELVKGKTLFDALCSLVFEYSLICTVKDLQSEAEQEMQIHKSHLVPMVLFDGEGKTKAINGKNKSDLENKMFKIARFYQQWYGLNFVVPACRQICSEHTLSLEDLSFIFDENSFIPRGREPIYAQGLLAGLKGDLLIATHLLVPQLENSLRHILKQGGFVASKRSIIQEDFTLGKILDSPDLLKVLNKDIVFALKGLLNEPMGSNLRNEICHGLFDYDQFSIHELPYLWWLTLYFCLVPVRAMV